MGTDRTLLMVSVSSDRLMTLVLAGELDASTVEQTRAAFESLPDGERSIDATAVSFIGASGLGLFIDLAAEAEAAGRELVISPSASVRRLAEIAGVVQTLTFA